MRRDAIRRAIVLFSKCDPVTTIVAEAAKSIPDILEGQGYKVTVLEQWQLGNDDFHVSVREAQMAGTPYSLVVVVAHGNNDGIYEKNGGRKICETASFRGMVDAIVCLCACMKEGDFCRAVCTEPAIENPNRNCVNAVLSYQPRVRVFPSKSSPKLKVAQRTAWKHVMEAHARSLEPQARVSDIKRKIEDAWRESIRHLDKGDLEFALVFADNKRHLRLDGNPAAKLV